MSKRKTIDMGALEAVAGDKVTPIKKLEAKQAGRAPSREGKVQIGAFVPEATRTRLKILAIEQGKGVGDLIEEAIGTLLSKHKK